MNIGNRFLGIDYGIKRVGVAISDEEGRIAFPKTVLQNDTYLLGSIKQFCDDENIVGIVIGESKDYKGKPNSIMEDIWYFKKMLENDKAVPVYLEPEFMTSVQARHIQGNIKNLDASAATIILQSFLDKRAK